MECVAEHMWPSLRCAVAAARHGTRVGVCLRVYIMQEFPLLLQGNRVDSDHRALLNTEFYAPLSCVTTAGCSRERKIMAPIQGRVFLDAAPAFGAGLIILQLYHLDPLENTFSHCFQFLLGLLSLCGGVIPLDVILVLLACVIPFLPGESAAFLT